VYTALSLEYCDLYADYTVTDAKVIRIGENTTAGNISVEMRNVGNCRDCDLENIH
jgi:hypothetical protein